MKVHPEYIVDEDLNKKCVVLPYSEWRIILEEMEELDDEILPFEQAVKEIENGKI